MLNLRQVETFVAAARRGSMTAAAEQLGVSQSAVSLAIAALEAQLGTQLFLRRRSRGLALTAAGQEFLPAAAELLAQADQVLDDVQREGRELTGRLVVGCFSTIAPFIMPALLETFALRHPAVDLVFIEAPLHELESALLEGRCELALLYDLDIGPGIALDRLFETQGYALISPTSSIAARPGPLSLRELAEEELVLLDVPPSSAYILGGFHKAGLSPRIRYRVSSLELVRSLVARRLGYALLISRPRVDQSYEGLPLEARELSDKLDPTSFSVGWVAGTRRTRRAQAFADCCREMLPDQIFTGAHTARRPR